MSLPTSSFLEDAPRWLRDTALSVFPDSWQWLLRSLVNIVAILAVFGLLFAALTLAERKILARVQNRPGPNRTGPGGMLQPFADAIKMITKEDIVPLAADGVLHYLAPVLLVGFSLISFSVIPYGRQLCALDIDSGLLFFFAAGASTELAIFMAGWGSYNKYSMLAAMRALAQLISYELPLILSVVPVVLVSGSLSPVKIVEAQGGWTLGFLPHWNVFTPWGLAGFAIFLISALAESNRSPFDLPEAESELIAGHLTEYSGFKYALFFMAEYFGMTSLCSMGVALFLGGWQAPCAFLEFIPSYVWFGIKLLSVIAFFMWIRGTLPRLRMDQLMRLAWSFLVPIALLNLVNTAIWELTASSLPGAWLILRWAVGLALILVPYYFMSRFLTKGRGKRTYRYAT